MRTDHRRAHRRALRRTPYNERDSDTHMEQRTDISGAVSIHLSRPLLRQVSVIPDRMCVTEEKFKGHRRGLNIYIYYRRNVTNNAGTG
jgi:hypothetical protein